MAPSTASSRLALLFLLIISLAAMTGASAETAKEQFARFKALARRSYNSPAEEAARFDAFQSNLKLVEDLRSSNPDATFDINERNFDFMKKKSKKQKGSAQFPSLRLRSAAGPGPAVLLSSQAPPSKLDWREHGAVSAEVPNMGECGGACVGFVLAGNIEGVYYVKNRATLPAMVPVSPQQLLDCPSENEGCDGAEIMDTYSWVLRDNHGEVATNQSYPWTGNAGNCTVGNFPAGAKITGVLSVPKTVEALTAYTARYGPIAVTIDADSLAFYTGGILSDCSNNTMDDAALLVGYDDTASTPYWTLRQSWGSTWGEGGYFRIAKYSEACGVLSNAFTAIAAGDVDITPTSPPQAPPPEGANHNTAIIAGAAGACVFIVLIATVIIVQTRRGTIQRRAATAQDLTQELNGQTVRGNPPADGTPYSEYKAPVV